jgi:hypothetical protein
LENFIKEASAWLNMAVHASNSSTWETEAGGALGQPGLLSETLTSSTPEKKKKRQFLKSLF